MKDIKIFKFYINSSSFKTNFHKNNSSMGIFSTTSYLAQPYIKIKKVKVIKGQVTNDGKTDKYL